MPTTRVTVIASRAVRRPRRRPAEWLGGARAATGRRGRAGRGARGVLNRALHAYRAARADPYARDVARARRPRGPRSGSATGEAVADGRYAEAWELPARGRRRTAALDGGPRGALRGAARRRASSVLACEELVLRARADLDAGRLREAALQARVALESLLAELGGELRADRRAALEADREPVGDAAKAALRGALSEELGEAVERPSAGWRRRCGLRRLSSAS